MRPFAPLILALSLVLTTVACAGSDDETDEEPERPPASALTAAWEPSPDSSFPGSITGEVVVPGSGSSSCSTRSDF